MKCNFLASLNFKMTLISLHLKQAHMPIIQGNPLILNAERSAQYYEKAVRQQRQM